MLMLTGGLLTSILTGGISSLGGNFTLYSLFTAHYNGTPLEILYVILAYALLPALGEELVFRSILCAEYEKKSVPVAVTVSALFFAMLHFSFPHFLTYLFLGLLLALSMYATRSALTPILLHFGYNLFCLFGQPYLSAFYVNAGSNRIFVFCLTTLFLLFAALAAGEGRMLYHFGATLNVESS
jgi:membrane protease YdiL (CAAX protease family)